MSFKSHSKGSVSISSNNGGFSRGVRLSPLLSAIPKSNLNPSTPSSFDQHLIDSIISFLTIGLFAEILFPQPVTSSDLPSLS